MSAILILLGLLSIATLASRQGYAAFVVHIVTTPILLAIGVLIAPDRLAFLTYSTAEALQPAMRVGVAWLALLVGLRGIRPSAHRAYWGHFAVAALVTGLTWAGMAAACLGLLYVLMEAGLFLNGGARLGYLVGTSVLLGGILSTTGLSFADEALAGVKREKAQERVLFLARHDDFCGALALVLAVWLWPLPPDVAPIYTEPWRASLVIVGLGAALALALGLAGGTRMGGASATWVALLGLITLASGLSASTLLPEAAIAFFLGATLIGSGMGERLGAQGLAQTERPVRLVVLVLIGVHLGFSPVAIALGAGLAIARLLLKLLVRVAFVGRSGADVPLSALLGSSSLSLPLALSFAFTRTEPLGASEILTAAAVCISVNDLLTLVTWRRSADAQAGDGQAQPPTEEKEAP